MSLLQPSKTKYRKEHRGTLKGIAVRGAEISFGDYGIKTVEAGFLTSRQIESARKVIVRHLQKGGRVWIRIFPAKPYTKKPLEVPMGGGKGSVEMYRAPVKPGRMLFEISGVSPQVAREIFTVVGSKLPVKTKIIIP